MARRTVDPAQDRFGLQSFPDDEEVEIPSYTKHGNPYDANKYLTTRYSARPDAGCLRWRGFAGTGCRRCRGGRRPAAIADRITCGQPHVRRERRVYDAHLVLDERDLLFGHGLMVGRQGDFRQSARHYAHRERQLLSQLYRPGRERERLGERCRLGYATGTPGSHGVPCGEPHLCRERGVFDAYLVLDGRDLLHGIGIGSGIGSLVERQSNQRFAIDGCTDEYPHVFAELFGHRRQCFAVGDRYRDRPVNAQLRN